MVGVKPLLIAAYYRPSEHDLVSGKELKKSLALVDPSKSHILVLGGFNYPKLEWEETQPILKQNCQNHEIYQDFFSILGDNCLTQISQMVSEPTREDTILDLFLTNGPTLVDSVSVVPGISDHQVVFAVVKLRPTVQKIKSRTMQLFFFLSRLGWYEASNAGISSYIPSNLSR